MNSRTTKHKPDSITFSRCGAVCTVWNRRARQHVRPPPYRGSPTGLSPRTPTNASAAVIAYGRARGAFLRLNGIRPPRRYRNALTVLTALISRFLQPATDSRYPLRRTVDNARPSLRRLAAKVVQ